VDGNELLLNGVWQWQVLVVVRTQHVACCISFLSATAAERCISRTTDDLRPYSFVTHICALWKIIIILLSGIYETSTHFVYIYISDVRQNMHKWTLPHEQET